MNLKRLFIKQTSLLWDGIAMIWQSSHFFYWSGVPVKFFPCDQTLKPSWSFLAKLQGRHQQAGPRKLKRRDVLENKSFKVRFWEGNRWQTPTTVFCNDCFLQFLKRLFFSPGHRCDQCDQMARFFFSIWPFSSTKICPRAYKIYQSRSKILPNSK